MSEEVKNGEQYRKIVDVPMEQSGLHDAVQMIAKCSVTDFKLDEKGAKTIGDIALRDCKFMASYEAGTASFSVQGAPDFMVTVRLDELMAILQAASIRASQIAKEQTGTKSAPKTGAKKGSKKK